MAEVTVDSAARADAEVRKKVQDKKKSDLQEPTPLDSGSQSESDATSVICDSGHFRKRNVQRREKRAKTTIKRLRKSLQQVKRVNRRYREANETLLGTLEETRGLVKDKNKEIKRLKRAVGNLEQMVDVLEDELRELRKDNDKEHNEHEAEILDLSQQIQELQQKDKSQSLSTFSSRTYTANVRELYYALLAMRLPPGQIKAVVRNVITHLVPHVDSGKLRLPGKSCATYMRSQEMPTISRVHKATDLIQTQQWHLNSDGTTLHQQKKIAFLINGIILGVHDVSDGSAQVALDALKHELAKVKEVADKLSYDTEGKELSIEHIVSSTSDGASTQGKFNRLLEAEASKTKGTLVTNKCSMHLGVNLRKAHVKAVAAMDAESDDTNSEIHSDDVEESEELRVKKMHHDIDKVVHETAKLFGHLGTPEYCVGAETFRIFLSIKARECAGVDRDYYECAQKVFLERQVGSRYYVTAYNAGRIFFLRKAMVAFLNEQKLLKSLNILETSCLEKLQDSAVVANLKLEGLLFDKVYSDLMMLVKSILLNKSAIDMNVHYEELLDFLELLTVEPKVLLDFEATVFKSELQLYSQSSKVNHRLKKSYLPVRNELYQSLDSDETFLLPMVCAAATAMSSKLRSYKQDHLPGGRYYDPSPEVHSVLSTLKPHNDTCESVFGCNDWLTKILPNMAQATRSAIIEVACNRTMEWLKAQGQQQKKTIIALAQARRELVQKETRKEKQELHEQKIAERKKIIEAAVERERKRYHIIQELKSDPLVSTVDALNQRVTMIMSLSIPQSIKEAELKTMVRRQVQLRTQVFQQKRVKIVFTVKGRPKTSSELLKELSAIIVSAPVRVRRKEETVKHKQLYVVFDKPSVLTGVKIRHQFQATDGTLQWYDGVITSYKRQNFTIHYEATAENCEFTVDELKEDLFSGDLWIQ